MPAMKEKLTRADVDKLVLVIRGFQGGRQRIDEEHDVAESARAEPHPDRLKVSARPPDHPPAPSAGSTRPSEVPPRSIPIAFQRYCVQCHGASGDGAARRSTFRSIPDFTSRAWQEQHSESRLKTSILEGRGSAMPPFSGRIDEPSAAELVAFVRSLAGMAPPVRQSSNLAFEDRFQRLMMELEALKREYRTLSTLAASGADRQNDALTNDSTGHASAREVRVAQAPGKR
jgi:hypothetical protein